MTEAPFVGLLILIGGGLFLLAQEPIGVPLVGLGLGMFVLSLVVIWRGERED